MSRRPALTLLLAVGIAALAGCKPDETIRSYSVNRTSEPETPVDASQIAAQLDHILTAVVPQGDQAWFFKLSGPAAAIDRQREEFLQLIASVKLAEQSGEPPTWKLPGGWQEQPGTQMRLATLTVPDKQGELEVSVSSLPMTGDWEDYMLRNVNRWLGQLQQSPLDGATVSELAKPIDTQSGAATYVELRGLLAKRSPGSRPLKTVQPTEQPPADDAQPLSYQAPAGWQPGRVSPFRKAAFVVTQGDAQAEITVSNFPAAPGTQMADVGENVRRWAGQVGLTETSPAALQDLAEPITISQIEGNYVELFGPDTPKPPKAMLVAMVQREGQVWFFKMMGDSQLVASQQEDFRSFLASVRFP